MNALRYIELIRKGIDPFPVEQDMTEIDEDKLFEQLGALVEQHPVGRP